MVRRKKEHEDKQVDLLRVRLCVDEMKGNCACYAGTEELN